MDITFQTDEGRFNYRTAAIIIKGEKLLAMRDVGQPYYYIPGGRVHMNETAEDAVLREVREELFSDARILRPLWVCQSFFTEEVENALYHEICFYYLVEVKGIEKYGSAFTLSEGNRTHEFRWMDFADLKSEYIYPLFLKDKIFDLPEMVELITVVE